MCVCVCVCLLSVAMSTKLSGAGVCVHRLFCMLDRIFHTGYDFVSAPNGAKVCIGQISVVLLRLKVRNYIRFRLSLEQLLYIALTKCEYAECFVCHLNVIKHQRISAYCIRVDNFMQLHSICICTCDNELETLYLYSRKYCNKFPEHIATCVHIRRGRLSALAAVCNIRHCLFLQSLKFASGARWRDIRGKVFKSIHTQLAWAYLKFIWRHRPWLDTEKLCYVFFPMIPCDGGNQS